MSHNLRKFTHVEACCVAFERGVRDGDCDRAARRGRGIDCAALYKVDVPPRDVEHRAGSERILEYGKTATYILTGLVALKSARLNCQSGTNN